MISPSSIATVHLVEEPKHLSSATAATHLSYIQEALEAAGIEFVDGDAPGVRLHPKAPKRKR